MDQQQDSVDYGSDAPILIAGDSDAAIDRATRTIAASGQRVAGRVAVEDAAERMRMQARTGAVWVELSRDGGGAMDALLATVEDDAAAGRYAAVVSAPAELIDIVARRVTDRSVELLFDGDDAERAAALAIATSKFGFPGHVADVASDNSAARLRQLSEEVGRIATSLARLSTGPAAGIGTTRPPRSDGPAPEIDPEVVRAVIRSRRLRAAHFEADLFADPAWDMLLDLTQAELAQHRVPVSSLCIAAAVPPTTALRWIKTMTDRGLFVRRDDPRDGRRVFIEMAAATSAAMRRYFSDVGRAAAV